MKKPNIVLIISDALRPRDLSLYGYAKETDKNLKKIASHSLVFENAFSTSNSSDPSVTSLFSGQYPSTNGFIHQHPFMKEEELSKLRKNKFWLPIYLQKKGYSTISTTPLHLWFKKGFDYYKEREIKGGGKFLNLPFMKRVLLKLPGWVYSWGKKMIKSRASPQFYSCYQVINTAISKIKENKPTRKPFFMFMHLVDTHYPYALIRKQNIGGNKTLKNIISTLETDSQKEYIKKRFFDIGASSFEEIEKRRDLSIKEVDKAIWKLYSFLKKSELLKNTIFIILSDHGDNFGEHNTYFCRGGLYDPSVRVPLIMHIPNIPGRRIKELVQTIDIPPTLLELMGKKFKMDGKSLLPLIKNQKVVRKKVISYDGFCEKSKMERTDKFKIIYADGSKCYLCGKIHNCGREEYDLIKDPEELNNLNKK